VFGAGVFLAVVGGSLLVAPTPALAVDPTVSIVTLGSDNLRSGEKTTLSFRVTNNLGDDATASVQIVVSGFKELRCTGQCTLDEKIAPGSSESYSVDLVAGKVEPGDKKSGAVTITATTGGDTGTASAPVTVRGPDAVQRIDGLKGRVRDEFGAAVPGATVVYLDSRNGSGQTTSSGDGSFSFASTDDKPIAPGPLRVGASKEGFKDITTTVDGRPGRSVTANLKFPSAAAPTPSATPSATAEPSAAVTEEPSAEAAPAAPAVDATTAATVTDDEGSSSLLFILGGGLLVAVGIGAMVLLFIKRKEKDPEDEDADLPAAPAVAAPTPTRYGTAGADVTRVAATRAGAPAGGLAGGPAPEATMVTTGAVPPALANAQTMLQPAVPADDEFPDPYGVPRPTPDAGHGARTQTWNAAAVPGQAKPPTAAAPYGAATVGGTVAASGPGQYGRPAAAGPYDDAAAPSGVYGTQAPGGAYGMPQAGPRYDEPTGRYNPDADQPAGAYGAAAPRQPGYGADQQYGGGHPATAPAPGPEQHGAAYGSGVDAAGTGYGSPGTYGTTGAGAYGAAAQPRYDEPTTYGRPAGGYEQGGGTYGRPAEPQPHDARPGQRGGYEEPGYYGGDHQHGRSGDADQRGYDDADDQPQQRGGPYTGGQYGTGPGGEAGRPGGQRRSLDWLDD
jgi:hypothetical protein